MTVRNLSPDALVKWALERFGEQVEEHYGPGPHDNGTDQDIHGGGVHRRARGERSRPRAEKTYPNPPDTHEEFVKRYRDADIEHIAIVRNGNVIAYNVGEQKHVMLPRADATDAVIIHNHPLPTPLSNGDIIGLKWAGAKEMRAYLNGDGASVARLTQRGKDLEPFKFDWVVQQATNYAVAHAKGVRKSIEWERSVSEYMLQHLSAQGLIEVHEE